MSQADRDDGIRSGPTTDELADLRWGEEAIRLRAIDISLSGIALLVADSRANYQKEMTIENCLLHLPDIGALSTDLTAQYLAPYGEGRRMGCRFSNFRATSLSHLQRYISRLERARLETREPDQTV